MENRFRGIFSMSTGKKLDGKEIFIGDILYHKRYGKMQVSDTVISHPGCLFLVRVPLDSRDRGFIEEINDLSWEEVEK